MSVVVDANLVAALALRDARAPSVERQLRAWQESGETLHAPSLLRYEVINALVRSVVTGRFPRHLVAQAGALVLATPIEYHEVTEVEVVLTVAEKLHRQNAYDAAYVALAERLAAELWTLDGRLARNAAEAGLPVLPAP